MNFDSPHCPRKSIRLREYDYSSVGAYFVTICSDQRKCLFGDVVNEQMVLSNIGKIAESCWEEIPQHHQYVNLDYSVVMPNHVHGILFLTNDDDRRDVQLNAPTRTGYYSKISPSKYTLSVVIRTYKAAVTRLCRLNDHDNFKWQRNYFDRIIRDEDELNRIREYIQYNSLKWQIDADNPENWEKI